MKKLLFLCSSLILVFLMLGTSSAYASTNESDTKDRNLSQVVEYMNTHATQLELPETGDSTSQTYEILLDDGIIVYSTVSIENVTPMLGSTTSYPVELGGSYIFTWTLPLDAVLGGQTTIKLWYSVSANSYSSLSGSTTFISSNPPQFYSIINESMYYITASGSTLTATGYTSFKPSLANITYNRYYDVEIFGTSGYVNITYNAY